MIANRGIRPRLGVSLAAQAANRMGVRLGLEPQFDDSDPPASHGHWLRTQASRGQCTQAGTPAYY